LRCRTDQLYTGCTTDLERRVREHNSGTGSRFTRSRLPVAVVYKEEAPSRSEALRRERAIKGMPRSEKLRLVGHAAFAASAKTGLSALHGLRVTKDSKVSMTPHPAASSRETSSWGE